ncbi:MAG: apolipoprotein N-acyltransferase [candidate division WOR-3 bacterium]
MSSFPLIFLSFLLYLLSFPPFKIFPASFIALVPLLLALKKMKTKQILLIALFYFYIFWLFHTWWILNMEVEPSTKPWLVAGLVILPLYLAIYNSIPFLLIKHKYRILVIPSLWILLEFIRSSGYTGFPWENIAYSQLENPYFRMLNSVGGIFFSGFLIIFLNVLLFEYLETRRNVYFRIFLLLLLTTHGLGAYLYHKKEPVGKPVKVLIFQPNILPREEDDYEEWVEVCKSYGMFLDEVKDTYDLVILPESAIPGYFRYSLKANIIVDSISRKAKAPVLLGSADVQFNGKRRVYNTAFLVSEDSILGQYNKIHLVPFGEWLPYENKIKLLQRIEFGQGDFSPGDSINVLHTKNGVPFGALICFESIFPYISREYSKKGAEFLVNITSDGWYGRSLGPVEHFEHLRFRAIESGKYILRSAKTGISAVIDPKGRVLQRLGLFTWGYIPCEIESSYTNTIYTRIGDCFVFFCFVLLIFLFIIEIRRNKK